MVLVREAADPSYHLRGGESGAVGDFEVEHAGEGDAVFRPAAAVGDEEGGLGGAGGGAGLGEVVAAADEVGVCGAAVMGRELWVAC